MPPRRAVITGIGVACSIGLTPDACWESLAQGRGGIRRIRQFDPSGLPVQFGGEIEEFDAKKYIDKKERKSLKVMARSIQLAVAAAQTALDDGKVGKVDLEKWGGEGLKHITPLWMLKYLPNMLACHVSILHNAQGPSNTVTQSDVAGLLALGEAYRVLVRDQADFFLVGGGESRINPLSMVRQCLFDALSRRNDTPEKACRPFDRRRDGFVLGEGGGVFVLEELEHARRRGARIYGEVVGFGAAFDATVNPRIANP